jgi:hypothetical protein
MIGSMEDEDDGDVLDSILGLFNASNIRAVAADPRVLSFLRQAKDAFVASRRPADPHYSECPPRYAQPPPPPPPPPRQAPHIDDARVVLGFGATIQLTEKMVKSRQRELAAVYHPDRGGSEESMKRVNLAVAALLAQIR